MLLAECTRCKQLFQAPEEDLCPACTFSGYDQLQASSDRYRVVSEIALEDLQAEVNRLMGKGWLPVGGVSKTTSIGGVMHLQAMVFGG